MTTVTETTVLTEVLTTILNRVPTSDEIESGLKDSLVMARVHEKLNIGTRVHSVAPGDDLQAAIDDLAEDGNGILHLQAGTFDITSNITIPSGINLQGTGTATILDFGGGAFQLQVIGTDAYTTGTITIANGDTTVVGSSTAWGEGLVGEYIFLQDLWYEITAFTDTTHITIAVPYAGTDLSASVYTAAEIVSSVEISGMTLQNSTTDLIKVQYTEDVTIDDIFFSDGGGAVDADVCGSLFIQSCFVDSCTKGFYLTDCWFGAFTDGSAFNITGGDAINLNLGSNWLFDGISIEGVVGNGISLTSWGDTSFSASTIKEVTGKGMEFVSGCDTNAVESFTVRYCGSDGIKLTATTDSCQFYGINFDNNVGYGFNIAAASCDNNIIALNNFASNTAGNINNQGTGTKIGLNGGVNDTVRDEVPSGSGTAFTLATVPYPESLQLFRGGARQREGDDFTISGASITLTTTLASGEVLLADYGVNFETVNRIRDEVPSGSDVTFTLAHTPLSNTLQLFRGGARQQAGAGKDYTISGAIITLAVTLATGEVLLADYDY